MTHELQRVSEQFYLQIKMHTLCK